MLFIFIGCDFKSPEKPVQKEQFQKLKKSSSKPNKKNILKNKKAKNSKLINNQNVKKKLGDYARKNKSDKVKITTKFGDITLKLYDDTPLHRANFIMLVNRGFFDSTLFYRVIRNFMIQGGNSDKGNMLQKMATIGHYRIPPEIKENHIHKRGALAMAVQEQYYIDPSKHDPSSSPYNFYIVQNGPISDKYMDKLEEKYQINISEKSRKIYRKIGGNPHLDKDYTVFGEVTRGMSVVDKISKLITDDKNRPLKNIYLTMKVVN